jgi:Phosphodiester glycosidase
MVVVILILVPILVWLGTSLGVTLANPAYGSSLASRLAEWGRQNHAGGVVNWVENEWYSHHPPAAGGEPPPGAIHRPKSTPQPVDTGPMHLPPPPPMTPLASPRIAGEGQWSPVGRTVDGIPTVYETTLRPDAVHTSYVAGVAWMDTELLRATLFSGSQIPGPGTYSHTAPIKPSDATSLVAAFNAGFLMSDANGGYYTDGRTIFPLIAGAASFVVYKDGSSTVGQWGRDVTLTPAVSSVRQNLALLVDHGRPVPGLNAADTTQWGFTLGNQVYVWRSGLGVTTDGALVYVGGPGLNITDLANLLVDAGAVRAMELDINTDWVNYSVYSPAAGEPAAPTNGATLLPTMTGGPSRYFEPWWSRDFITMSLR